ncbi:MAG: NUDIX domain-containing protein [Candidatus Pacearchaeota archaeon]
MKIIVASGPVIIENGKLLVDRDNKDDFYKIPGGTIDEDLSLEDTCKREVKEEINGDIEIIKPLNPMVVWKNQQTGERMMVVLIHYSAKLLNKNKIKPISPVREVMWLDINEIKQGKHNVANNIKFLIKKGDIK